MKYKVTFSDQFNRRFREARKLLPRIGQLKHDLTKKLETKPFDVGYHLPKRDNWKYGFYYFAKSLDFGKFSSYRFVYRITDDKVEVLYMSALKL